MTMPTPDRDLDAEVAVIERLRAALASHHGTEWGTDAAGWICAVCGEPMAMTATRPATESEE